MNCVLFGLALLAIDLHGGVITGIVSAEGKADPQQAGGSGRYESRKFKFVEKINYADLRDFVVSIEGPLAGLTNAVGQPQTRRVLTQKDAVFHPHVLPVEVGTTVEWPNKDEIYHNVFSMSEAKPFDLGLYKGSPREKAITFDKGGQVDVFCSIHSQMHCVILVLDNPFFAVTDARGRYRLSGVPGGTYRLKAWHERLPAEIREVVVPENGEVKMNFTLGIKNLPKY